MNDEAQFTVFISHISEEKAVALRLQAVKRLAVIETGQESENIQVTGQISARAMTLTKVCSLEELEGLKARMEAQIEKERIEKQAKPAVLPKEIAGPK